MYSIFIRYFDNPSFTKIKNQNQYSMYMCRIPVQLANSYRYLVCLVKQDVYLTGTQIPLSELKWDVFQTRSLSSIHQGVKGSHHYQPKHGRDYAVSIQRTEIKDEETIYECELGLQISLLPKKNNLFDYPARGTLNSALETYNTIVIKK